MASKSVALVVYSVAPKVRAWYRAEPSSRDAEDVGESANGFDAAVEAHD
jgi:hypothetical protein